MSHSSPFQDSRAVKLLSRVGEDLSQLRQDLRTFLSHTAHHTVPNGAQELAGRAKDRLAAGGAYAASRLRSIRGNGCDHSAASVLGGALLVGALALGVYALCKANGRCQAAVEEPPDESGLV